MLKEVPPPTYYEVNQVIENLKMHKAAGSDNIPAQLIGQGGTELKTRIHKLIMKIWDEETLPTEWTKGIICPIYKKGDRMICSNYRPTALLNVVYKIFSILINNRFFFPPPMPPHVLTNFRGFPPGCGDSVADF